jgi:hypothetical protein
MKASAVSRRALQAALVDVAAAFAPGELAYLAHTSKPEHAIRDRLAWVLSQAGYRVAREWRDRCDLAILDDDYDPLIVLESKAAYTHNVRWGWKPEYKALQAIVGGEFALETVLRAAQPRCFAVAEQARGTCWRSQCTGLTPCHRGCSS